MTASVIEKQTGRPSTARRQWTFCTVLWLLLTAVFCVLPSFNNYRGFYTLGRPFVWLDSDAFMLESKFRLADAEYESWWEKLTNGVPTRALWAERPPATLLIRAGYGDFFALYLRGLAGNAGLSAGLVCVITLVRRRLTRRVPGHCAACDYDLTGNVSGVCPECGQPVPSGPTYESRREL